MISNIKSNIDFTMLSNTVTETDFENKFIIVQLGTTCIGCKFKNCIIFVEDAKDNKFIRCEFGGNGNLVPVKSANNFIETFIQNNI